VIRCTAQLVTGHQNDA